MTTINFANAARLPGAKRSGYWQWTGGYLMWIPYSEEFKQYAL